MSIDPAAQAAISYYLGLGLQPSAAIGIPAVLYVESRLNPGSQGVQPSETPGVLNPSGAYGIASWNGPRQAALQTAATQHSASPGSLYCQLYFVLNECADKYPKVWAAIQQSGISTNDIITAFVDGYEIPANTAAEIAKAEAYAAQFAAANVQPMVGAQPWIGQGAVAPVPVPAPAPTPTPSPTPVPTTEPASNAVIKAAIITMANTVITLAESLT